MSSNSQRLIDCKTKLCRRLPLLLACYHSGRQLCEMSDAAAALCPAGLKYPLFKYQKQALAWMSYRELLGTAGPAAPELVPLQKVAAAADMGEPSMHPCWEHHLLPSGVEVFGNRLSGGHMHAAQILLGRSDGLVHEGSVQHQCLVSK